MEYPYEGWSPQLRVETMEQSELWVTIKHLHRCHFVLEAEQTLQHDEEARAAFNFALDGRSMQLQLSGTIKRDRLYGLRFEFAQAALLGQLYPRLRNAVRYEPLHNETLVEFDAMVARSLAPSP